MSLTDRILVAFGIRRAITRSTPLDQWSDPFSLEQMAQLFTFNGLTYPFIGGQMSRSPQEQPSGSFESYVQAIYKRSSIVFACMAARAMLFSEARFQFQRLTDGRPGELFGGDALERLEVPWPKGTTGDLLNRMIQHVDIGGNSYTARIRGGARVMRPDWVTIVIGSQDEPRNDPGWQVDAEIAAFLYQPGGPANNQPVQIFGPDEVAHYAPYPDPAFRFRGMSPLTPVIREVLGDGAAQEHKLKFFENGATPNFAVSLGADIGPEAFKKFKAAMDQDHKGVANAYKTLYLAGGATVQRLGVDFQQVDFKKIIGAGETRIAAAFGVPPIIVGLSEGLESATYSNYGQARRRFADGTMRPLWRGAAAALQTIIDMPKGRGVRLWYDDRDISFLQEDLKDAAAIQQLWVQNIKTLMEAGFKFKNSVEAVMANDLARLAAADAHTGMFSVQLQPPGTAFTPNGTPPAPGTPATPALPAPPAQAALPAPKRAVLEGRELEVAAAIAEGLTNKEIAARLDISERTVERLVSAALERAGVPSRAALAAWVSSGGDRDRSGEFEVALATLAAETTAAAARRAERESEMLEGLRRLTAAIGERPAGGPAALPPGTLLEREYERDERHLIVRTRDRIIAPALPAGGGE